MAVEIRTINNRFFKLAVRTSEGYASLEPLVESDVRARPSIAARSKSTSASIAGARRKTTRSTSTCWTAIGGSFGSLARSGTITAGPSPLEALLPLPGVVDDASGAAVDAAADWPLIERDVAGRVGEPGPHAQRRRPGHGRRPGGQLPRWPPPASTRSSAARRWWSTTIATGFSTGSRRRLAELQVTLDPADLIKEVSLFADRSDISEEIVRLRSHLEQFQATMELPESSGRKLDFLTQEMFRETNTIGSKANDVEIARR